VSAAPVPVPTAGPAPRRGSRPLVWWALAAAAALPAWSLATTEPDEPPPASRRAALRPARGPDAPDTPAARADARSSRAADLPPAAVRALQSDLDRWARRSGWPLLPAPARSAWGPPPAPPAPPVTVAAAPQPSAPPFPYQLVGRWEEPAATGPVARPGTVPRPGSASSALSASPASSGDTGDTAGTAGTADRSAAAQASEAGVVKVVIAGPASTWVLGRGDVIDGQWRIDRISPRAIELTYLPLQSTQTVAMKSP